MKTRFSNITDNEACALADSGLCLSSPYAYSGVSTSPFSVARFYGGCTIKGKSYTYLPETDELVRDDVMKFLAKYRNKKVSHDGTPKQDTLI